MAFFVHFYKGIWDCSQKCGDFGLLFMVQLGLSKILWSFHNLNQWSFAGHFFLKTEPFWEPTRSCKMA